MTGSGMGPTVVDPGGMTRRQVLKALGIGIPGTMLVGACVPATEESLRRPDHDRPDPDPFPDGVIAGDPLEDGTVIWTRIAGPAGAPIEALWTVATDPGLTTIVAAGVLTVDATTDHCAHVRVSGLAADRWYFYGFEAGGDASRVGRLRTAPLRGSSPDRLRFAFASCQQLNDSWFVAHERAAAEPDLDFFLHLGDYVYVNDDATLTLEDYRACYRRWRAERGLRDLHAALPLVAMWDDGEFYNGVDRNGDPTRLAAARRAWFDHQPVLDDGSQTAYRSLSWGSLVDLPLIDTRRYRDPEIAATDYTTGPGLHAYDPERSTLGTEQHRWFIDQLVGSDAAWRIVGNGVPISPWRLLNLEFLRAFRPGLPPNAGVYAPAAGFDDFIAERRDLLRALDAANVVDTVFATGETHIAIASELRVDPDAGGPATAVEFVSPSMTADPDPKRSYLGDLPTDLARSVLRAGERWVLTQNPGMRHLNLEDQGYVVVDVDPERIEVTYRRVDTFDPEARPQTSARFRVRRGSSRLEVLGGGGGSFG